MIVFILRSVYECKLTESQPIGIDDACEQLKKKKKRKKILIDLASMVKVIGRTFSRLLRRRLRLHIGTYKIHTYTFSFILIFFLFLLSRMFISFCVLNVQSKVQRQNVSPFVL